MIWLRPVCAPVLRSLRVVCAAVLCLGLAVSACAQLAPSPALRPVPQIHRVARVDTHVRVPLAGHVPNWVQRSSLSASPVDATAVMRLRLVLQRSAVAEAAFQHLLEAQQTPGSPLYHQAVTPEEQGRLYGPTADDLAAVAQWARSQGLTVGALSPSHTILELTGNISTVEAALHVHFSLYATGVGADVMERRAPDAEPEIPAALASVVGAIAGLTDENAQPMLQPSLQRNGQTDGQTAEGGQASAKGTPFFTGSMGGHFITPADFAMIYDVTPVYNADNIGAMTKGMAQHVAILGDSAADAQDVQAFFTGIGRPNPNYNVLLADGVSPGFTKGQGEAELDLERVLGTAPGVTVDLVEGTGTSPLYDAANYAVNTLQDPVITMSFGECETNLGAANQMMWRNLWATAAGNMTSVFVSGGDAGVAACDAHGMPPPATQAPAINGYCSTSSNTCVGGTEFNDSANPSQYWSTTNNTTTKASALGYIPEGAWNDPTRTDSNGNTIYLITAGGGGVSQFVPKPSWQTGPGVPMDGFRDTPDISLSASSYHDPYYFCGPGECTVMGQSSPSTFLAYGNGGTSASAPSMAAIAALLNAAAGTPQGNLDPVIYRLANSPVASQVFHDVTVASSGVSNCDVSVPSMCNNSTPGPNSLTGGLAGFLVGTGYDQATGWGSLDVANFLRGAIPVGTTLAIGVSGSAIGVAQGVTATATLTAAAASLASPTGTVQFLVNGAPSGTAVPLMGTTVSSGVLNFPAAGSYTLTAVYSGDALYVPSTASASVVSVSAQPPTFGLAANPAALSFSSGATTGNSAAVTLTAANNYVGSVALSCTVSNSTGTAIQPTCAVSPGMATVAVNGMATATVTISSASPQSAALRLPGGAGRSKGELRLAGLGAGLALASLLGMGRRRRGLPALLAMLLLFTGMTTLTGCGGGSSSAPTRSSAGSYTVTITGTGTGTGAIASTTATTTLAVTIQ